MRRRRGGAWFPPATIALLLALLPAAREACAQTVIVLNNTSGMDFGSFAAGTGGTIVLNAANGARSKTGTVILLPSPAATQAGFDVSKSKNGTVNKTVSISLPVNNTVQLSSGANRMFVNNFIASPASILSVPNSGTPLAVGATLVVGAGQPPGNYSGTFSITVNYN
ncbi:MAG: DUF4402 domain-containing protein [Pseudomonadota bacterium]